MTSHWGASLSASETNVSGFTPAQRAQLDAVFQEKQSWTTVEKKIECGLLIAYKCSLSLPIHPLAAEALRLKDLPTDAQGLTAVKISGRVDDRLCAWVTSKGGQVDQRFAGDNALLARIPLTQLVAVARDDAVRRMTLPSGGTINSINTSEGNEAHRADLAKTAFGVDGSGVTVGVLSNGVDGLADAQASDDLPADVQILPGQEGSGSAGVAMMEIIHDLAPGATLIFATAFPDEATMIANIHALAEAGCDIIVDDVSYFNEPVFQDGPIVLAIAEVTRRHDILYFSAIGNKGNKAAGTASVWKGLFDDSGTLMELPGKPGGALHDFDPTDGVDAFNDIRVASPFPTVLQWADPFGATGNDYDLCIIDANGNMTCSANVQDGDDDPLERTRPVQPGDRIVIVKAAGAEDRFVHLDTFGAGTFRNGEAEAVLEHGTSGAITGHAAAPEVVAVAAVRVARPAAAVSAMSLDNVTGQMEPGELDRLFANDIIASDVEAFSSDGPGFLLVSRGGEYILRAIDADPGDVFDPDKQAVVRQKPDIAAADGVSTSLSNFNPFFGTSASAPHAAATAAQLKELAEFLDALEARPSSVDDFSTPQDPLGGTANSGDIFAANEKVVGDNKRVMDIFVPSGSQGQADISNGSFNVSFEIKGNGFGASAVCYEGTVDLTDGGINDVVKLQLKEPVSGNLELTLFVNDAEGFSSAVSLMITPSSGTEISIKLSDFQFFGTRGADLSNLAKFGVSIAALMPGKSDISVDEVGTASTTDPGTDPGTGPGDDPNSAETIRSALVNNATDIGPFGPDNTSGFGLIDTLDALGGVATPSARHTVKFVFEFETNAQNVDASFGENDQPVRSNVNIKGQGTGEATISQFDHFPGGFEDPETGTPLSMEVFVDAFYDVTFTDVDPNNNYRDGIGAPVVFESVPTRFETSYTGIADTSQPNFGLFSQAQGWDWIRDNSISLGDGKTLFIPSSRLRTRLTLQIPDPNTEIFTDGFESGDTAAWTSSPPFEVSTKGTVTIKHTIVVPARTEEQ